MATEGLKFGDVLRNPGNPGWRLIYICKRDEVTANTVVLVQGGSGWSVGARLIAILKHWERDDEWPTKS